MKSFKLNIYFSKNCLTVFLLAALALGGCQTIDPDASAQTAICDAVSEIEGVYSCTGECIVTVAGIRQLQTVTGETDTIARFPGAKESLYQVNIGNEGFHEIEIGALTGRTLRTATAEVTGSQFPVLEEYVFDTDPLCRAVGFTKIVRNPSEKDFKACVIICKKSTD